MHSLSSICCDRNPDPKKQRKGIKALLKEGADINETDKRIIAMLADSVAANGINTRKRSITCTNRKVVIY